MLPAAKHAGQHVLFGLLLLLWNWFIKEQDDEIDIGTYEIEVTEFKSKVRFDLWGHLEVGMVSEATEMIVRGNIHIDTKVVKVVDYKSWVKLNLWGHGGCLEAALASEAIKLAVKGKMHMNPWVFKAADLKSEVKFDI